MIILKSVAAISLLVLLAGCSRSFHVAKIVPGKSSVDEVLHRLNEPIIVKKSSFDPETEIFAWRDLSIQLKNNIVTAVHRQPASHEKYMQFWKQYYKDEKTTFSPLVHNDSKDAYWQFNIPKKGINVIYNERIDEVVKVIFYEIH